MTTAELATAVQETLLNVKLKKQPFTSFNKKLGVDNVNNLVDYLLKYGEFSYERLNNLTEFINHLKDDLKAKEIEKTETELKELQEKLKKLKS
ncbi:MAG TPA: hypothetical protein VMT63_04760 [Bacteroidales bacterium]|nr:hypothetical protein [Bacteroidales bacterium]